MVQGPQPGRVVEHSARATEYSGIRRWNSRSTRSSSRARCDPRHRWTPPPKARWGLGFRARSSEGNPQSIGVATAGAERSADAEDGGLTWPDWIFGTHRMQMVQRPCAREQASGHYEITCFRAEKELT